MAFSFPPWHVVQVRSRCSSHVELGLRHQLPEWTSLSRPQSVGTTLAPHPPSVHFLGHNTPSPGQSPEGRGTPVLCLPCLPGVPGAGGRERHALAAVSRSAVALNSTLPASKPTFFLPHNAVPQSQRRFSFYYVPVKGSFVIFRTNMSL